MPGFQAARRVGVTPSVDDFTSHGSAGVGELLFRSLMAISASFPFRRASVLRYDGHPKTTIYQRVSAFIGLRKRQHQIAAKLPASPPDCDGKVGAKTTKCVTAIPGHVVMNVPLSTSDQAAEVFRGNFRALLASRWMSQKEAADEIGVRYKWVRRLCHLGLARQDKRTAASLKKVVQYFGLSTDDLWAADLPLRRQLPWNAVLIKWMGSKQWQATEIVSRFPPEIATYYEPFLGSGAVLLELMSSDVGVRRFSCSDMCKPLIGIWKLVKDDPKRLLTSYTQMWERLQTGGKGFYNQIRQEFNESGDPCRFFFLTRTCRIGWIQFNRKGQFNTPYHLGESGLPPDQVRQLLFDWSERLNRFDVRFAVRDYCRVSPTKDDFVYLDPPYAARQQRLYLGRFEGRSFFKWLSNQKCGWALSFNFSEPANVPLDFDEHHLLDNQTSPARRLNSGLGPRVLESLFIRRASR